MKNTICTKIILFVLLFINFQAFSQKQFTSPVEYNNYIIEKHNEIMGKYLVYIKTSVHSENDNKIDKKLADMIDEYTSVIKDLKAITPIAEDKAGFLNAEISALTTQKEVFENDYKNINSLGTLSTNSYEDMKNYYDAQDVASNKIKTSIELIDTKQNEFATDNGFTLTTSSKSKLSEQLSIVSEVSAYSKNIYLQYFRVYKPVSLLFEALNNKMYDVADSLNKEIILTATASIDSLNKMTTFKGNSTLKAKAKTLITYYKTSAETQFNQVIAISQKKDLTQVDVDKYNKIIETYNTKSQTYSNDYMTAYDTFMKTYIPE